MKDKVLERRGEHDSHVMLERDDHHLFQCQVKYE